MIEGMIRSLRYKIHVLNLQTVAVALEPFASHAEGWVFKSRPRQTGSDSSTVKHHATGASITYPRR